ncbi:hypothetical protein DIPPA_00333 [Diplonema papillatum]|nr:hypothetical protein DIPPA_00333 [Diplonema papillatum]
MASTGANLQTVAEAVKEAAAILVFNGPGNSVDSGVPCGEALCKGTMYEDLCMSKPTDFSVDTAISTPELFYGFWGRYYNMAMDATPHKGIAVLRSWVERMKRLEPIDGQRFFLYSQAIDGIVAKEFTRDAICEAHGSIRHWQCSAKCTDRVWQLPASFRFKIHPATLTCKAAPADAQAPGVQARKHYASPEHTIAPRSCLSPSTGYPQCPFCEKPAIPNTIELGVDVCVDTAFTALNYITWQMAIEELEAGERVVVIEIGCETRIPTAREEGEELTSDLNGRGMKTTFVRINTDDAEVERSDDETRISIPMPAEQALVALGKLVASTS